MCARRERALNSKDLPKAYKLDTNSTKGAWTCPSGYKFCGNKAATNANLVACIPNAYMCPINKVKFAGNTLSTKTDAIDGSPLVDIRLSQGGPPCINMRTDKNSLPRKQYLSLYPSSYYSGCGSWYPNGHKQYAQSTNH